MAMNYEMKKPTIHLRFSDNCSERVLREIQYGIEEEGIPFETEIISGLTALELAWSGANSSNLSVGVGLDNSSAIVNYSKLSCEKPLYQIPARSEENDLRAIGANAARLVKKLPLKPLNGR